MLDREAFARLVRFCVAGGASTILYGIFAYVLGMFLEIKFIYVHVIAFAAAVPFSYFLQKEFTFRYKGSNKKSSVRFLVTTMLAFLVSAIVSSLIVDVWGMPEWLGIIVVMVIVPFISFLSMSYWVFVDKKASGNEHG